MNEKTKEMLVTEILSTMGIVPTVGNRALMGASIQVVYDTGHEHGYDVGHDAGYHEAECDN
jgi:hypothetical protein